MPRFQLHFIIRERESETLEYICEVGYIEEFSSGFDSPICSNINAQFYCLQNISSTSYFFILFYYLFRCDVKYTLDMTSLSERREGKKERKTRKVTSCREQ